MSDTTPNPTPSGDSAGTAGGTQAPAGFVPQADLEREQARARSFQSELDRAKAELAAAQRTPAPTTTAPTDGASGGFDPAEFRRSLMSDVLSVSTLAQAAATLKTDFPHADPKLFERVAEFGNADALRIAVEDSHNRVATLIASERESIEAQLREEYGTKLGGGTPSGGAPGTPAGDPTKEQLASMSLAEIHELEKTSPGVVERVLRS